MKNKILSFLEKLKRKKLKLSNLLFKRQLVMIMKFLMLMKQIMKKMKQIMRKIEQNNRKELKLKRSLLKRKKNKSKIVPLLFLKKNLKSLLKKSLYQNQERQKILGWILLRKYILIWLQENNIIRNLLCLNKDNITKEM